MKKSLKALFMASMLPVMMLMAAVTLTSCEGTLDDIFGEWSRPTNQQNNEPTEDEIEAAQIREAVALLEEAQKEGSITTMYFTVSGTDYEATFKKVGTEFVLQELKSTKAATRGYDEMDVFMDMITVSELTSTDGSDDESTDEAAPTIDDGETTWNLDDGTEEEAEDGSIASEEEIEKDNDEVDNPDDENTLIEDDPVEDLSDNPAMPKASDQLLHFSVKDKSTGVALVDTYTNMGNSEMTEELNDNAEASNDVAVNGVKKTLGSGKKKCTIMLPKNKKAIIMYNDNDTWAKLVNKQRYISSSKGIVKYNNNYWLLDGEQPVNKSSSIRTYYNSSRFVDRLCLYTNVNNSVYSNSETNNSFRKGDKFYVRVEFNKKSDGAVMRDEFFSIISQKYSSLVSVKKLDGFQNVFEIEAIMEPTGEKIFKKFKLNFGYKDYNGKEIMRIFYGNIRLDMTSDQAAAEKLYEEIDDDGMEITDEVSISILVGDFVNEAAMISEAYAKPLAEKICTEKNLTSGVVLFMGGDETNGYDFYVISGDSNSKTHLASTATIPETWKGLTLFYVKK
jgi:hypothetical protein